jgi:hypothetical protein
MDSIWTAISSHCNTLQLTATLCNTLQQLWLNPAYDMLNGLYLDRNFITRIPDECAKVKVQKEPYKSAKEPCPFTKRALSICKQAL